MGDAKRNGPNQEDSLFTIGSVAHMTRITDATLRVWERRYQFPRAARSVGRQRQYTQQDVLQLLWVKVRMDGGMRARQAIRARQFTTRDSAVAATLHTPLPASTPPDPVLGACQHALLEALLAFDDTRAASILNAAVARYPLASAVLEIIGPVLSAIGESWSAGQVEVATEHFATNWLRHQLLTWMRISPPPFRVSPIALACAPEELHEGSLLMLGVVLRQLRWPVVYLGQSLPLAHLAQFTASVNPALLVFAAMSEATALGLVEWPRWLEPQPNAQRPLVGFGGRAFTEDPELAGAVPGVLLGATLREGSERIHRLMLDLNVLENAREDEPRETMSD